MKKIGRLIFLHGFLGDPKDWEGCINHLSQYPCIPLSYPFRVDSIPEEDILIGYSMGGRISIRYPHRKILISSHPGLKTKEEKDSRRNLDETWIEKLLALPFDKWLEAWYAQPLFEFFRNHPNFLPILSRRSNGSFEAVATMLSKESLANDNFFIPSNGIFIHGELDIKFKNLYKNLGIPSLEIKNVGHVCHLEDPEECAKIIDRAVRHFGIPKRVENLVLDAAKASGLDDRN